MFKLMNNLWCYNIVLLTIIFSTNIINENFKLIQAQTIPATTSDINANLSSAEETNFMKNLRPLSTNDRNVEKLLIVFDGACADSIDTVTEIVMDLENSFECLKVWISAANPNQNGIYRQANGNYHVYFEIDDPYNETTCIDNIMVDHQYNCIHVVDYELILYHQQCRSDGVYDYPDTTDYRWHRDSIDGIVDENYIHIDTSGADTVDVYVLDTGVYHTHYEFTQVKYTLLDPSYNITSIVVGHGTHVAGIIVGRTVGLTSHSLYDYPVCRGTSAACYSSYIDDAFSVIIARAQTYKRRGVINMSFGSSLSSSSISASSIPAYYLDSVESQMYMLVENGIIPVAAGGNSGKDACQSWPASANFTIGVGAHDSTYNVPSWSNYGPCVDIYSPGVNVVSSWIGSNYTYRFASGTSMATPMITGLVADILWHNSSITYDEIIERLQTSPINKVLSSCPSASSTVCTAVRVNCSFWYNNQGQATQKLTTTLSPTAKPTTTLSPTAKPTTTLSPTAKPTTTLSPTTKPTTTLSPTKKPTTTKSPTSSSCHKKGVSCDSYLDCCSQNCMRRTCQ